MKQNRKQISVFEHQVIKLNQEIDGVKFNEQNLKALQGFYGVKGVPYFSLIHNGVRFNEFVGVIQVGETTIEVLPKADNNYYGTNEKKHWRDILIDMLFAVHIFDIHAPSSSSLKLKSNSILDLYFELFIIEVEYLLHNGLIKKYRTKEGNATALKGRLMFGKQIQQNLTHQERFYVHNITYDLEHKLHFIIFKTIHLLKKINTNVGLHSRIGTLLLHFPEMPDIKITEKTFENLNYNRKNITYQKTIAIAKLLLLNFHPDVSKGKNNILALMFDMNKLWEKFVYISLYKHKEHNTTLNSQLSKTFWKPEKGYSSIIRPDIVIDINEPSCAVLDTKWKNLNGYNPSPEDLKQMYIYLKYYGSKKAALIYPGTISSKSSGIYLDPKTIKPADKECSVLLLSVENKITKWQLSIYNECAKWLNLPCKK